MLVDEASRSSTATLIWDQDCRTRIRVECKMQLCWRNETYHVIGKMDMRAVSDGAKIQM